MRLIDANALTDELIKGIEADTGKSVQTTFTKSVCMILCKAIEQQPTIDAVPLDGSFKKMSKGDYLIYDRHWLYEHFDQEIDIQRSVMESMGYEAVMELDDSELLFQRELWDRECEDD